MDIDLIRAQTIGCNDEIFVNSAGSSLMPQSVVQRMREYLSKEEKIGGYAAANMHEEEIYDFYVETAKLINAKPINIAYAASSVDAYAKVISAIDFKTGDLILTTNSDYISNQLAFLSLNKRFGVKFLRMNNLENGDLDLKDCEKLIEELRPKLVAITHIPSSSGVIQDAVAVGSICKKYGILYLLDACQSIGQILIDVKKIGCDFLTVTGRKFLRGPRGTGFLYVSDRVLNSDLAPLIFDVNGSKWNGFNEYKLRETAKRFEMLEFSYSSLLGLKEAVKYANSLNIREIIGYNAQLMSNFRKMMKQVPGLHLLDNGTYLSNILTFNVEHKSLKDIEELLKHHKVYYSVNFKTSSLIDYSTKHINWAVRLSPHYFNTHIEMEKIASILY